jgi:hypothetical protein
MLRAQRCVLLSHVLAVDEVLLWCSVVENNEVTRACDSQPVAASTLRSVGPFTQTPPSNVILCE